MALLLMGNGPHKALGVFRHINLRSLRPRLVESKMQFDKGL
jgi:hypothetical protein